MAQLQSSYLPPGLTDEDVELALAAARGVPPPAAQQPAPMPPPQAAPAAPAQPVAEPAPEPPAPMPEDPVVEMHTGGRPKDNAEAYTRDNVADANAIIANKREMGDERGLTAEDYGRMQGIQERSAAQNKATAQGARADVETRKKHEADMQARADRIFAEMEANKQPPPDSIASKVMGVIGSVIAMGSKNHGAAQGVAMLMNMVGDDKQRWAMERDANSQLYQAALKGISADREGAVNDMEIAQRMATLEALEINDSLEAAKSMGFGRHANAVIEETQRGVAMKTREFLRQSEEEKQKALDAAAAKQAAARAKAGRSAREDALYRLGIQALRELQANHQLDELGHKVLQDLIKQDQADKGGYAEVASKQDKALGLDGTGAAQSGSNTPSGRQVADPAVYNQLSAAEKKALADDDAAATSLASSIDKLLKLRESAPFWVGVPTSDEYQRAEAINREIKLAIKEKKKLGTLDKGSEEFLEGMTGSPTSWGDAPENKLGEIRESALRESEERARNAGLAPRRGGPGGASHAAAPGGSDPRVRKGFAGAVSTRAKPLSDEEILNQVRSSADAQEQRDRKDDETQAALARFMR